MNIILIYFAIKYNGDWNKIYEALEKKEKPILENLKKIKEDLKKSKFKVITIVEQNEYPEKLKNAYKPPFVIWIKGNSNIFKNKILCLTGNNVDKTINKYIDENISILDKKYEILSPGFKGVDNIIEQCSKKPLIKVLAHGMNSSLNENYLYITEFPPNVKHPRKEYFRQRNRIIAALSDQLILFSSFADGGINHLVSSFLNLGKEISCFPGNGNKNDGNSELIKQGANLITNINEIN